jgi:hypothetical protein
MLGSRCPHSSYEHKTKLFYHKKLYKCLATEFGQGFNIPER